MQASEDGGRVRNDSEGGNAYQASAFARPEDKIGDLPSFRDLMELGMWNCIATPELCQLNIAGEVQKEYWAVWRHLKFPWDIYQLQQIRIGDWRHTFFTDSEPEFYSRVKGLLT